MLLGDQQIQWLDVATNRVTTDTLSACVGKYYIKMVDDVIDFSSFEKAVKVTDWKGWSDLVRIKVSVCNHPVTSVIVTTEHGKVITGSPYLMLPVYDPSSIIRGFHGETKYRHIIVPILKIEVGDTLRVLHLSDDDGNSYDFDKVAKLDVQSSYSESRKIYSVMTKSQYMNVGDVYAFAGSIERASQINRQNREALIESADARLWSTEKDQLEKDHVCQCGHGGEGCCGGNCGCHHHGEN